jgi:hypothetical protein
VLSIFTLFYTMMNRDYTFTDVTINMDSRSSNPGKDKETLSLQYVKYISSPPNHLSLKHRA